ncbi:zinc-ribbon domain-containing protein [Methanobrevibacter sp.]|uniref:zinc-ribbon domain-containing protein n=1 Tax=Methanobrevibacter sp. TaxID=66852 RepID=UPI00386ADDC4
MVICSDCGKDVKDAKFCSNCGAVLHKVEEKPAEEVVDESVDKIVEENVSEEIDETVSDEVIEEGEIIEVNKVSEEPVKEPIEENTVKKSKFCTNCGAEITADTPFCPQCGFKLHQDDVPQTKFCQSCGQKININAEICPHCGVRVAPAPLSQEKSVAIAAILSFLFPGLGHLYNGLTRKGVSFIIAYIISAILIFLLIGIVLVFIVWIWALFDAIKTTEAINNGEFVEDKLI